MDYLGPCSREAGVCDRSLLAILPKLQQPRWRRWDRDLGLAAWATTALRGHLAMVVRPFDSGRLFKAFEPRGLSLIVRWLFSAEVRGRQAVQDLGDHRLHAHI